MFSAEHPVFTASGSQDWYYDAAGNILHFPVDNYYYEGKREAVFLGGTGDKIPQDAYYIFEYTSNKWI